MANADDFLDFIESKIEPEKEENRVVFIIGFRGWRIFVDGELTDSSRGFPYNTPDAVDRNLEDFKRGLGVVHKYEAELAIKN